MVKFESCQVESSVAQSRVKSSQRFFLQKTDSSQNGFSVSFFNKFGMSHSVKAGFTELNTSGISGFCDSS